MANAKTEVCLVELHAVMLKTIKAAFPALQDVVAYREEDDRTTPLTAPACLLEMDDELEPGDAPDPGTEQIALTCTFSARFVVGFRTENAKIEARKLATRFAAHLRKHPRWPGVVTGPAEVKGCYRDDSDGRFDQFVVWRVEWAHVLHFGETVWEPEGLTPTQVFSRLVVDGDAADPEQVAPT